MSPYVVQFQTRPKKLYKQPESGLVLEESLFHKLSRIKKPVPFLYELMIEAKQSAFKRKLTQIQKHWQTSLLEYQQSFCAIQKVTNIVKYRDFQYWLLLNAIHPNNRLFYWKKKESQKCDWCPHKKQTLKHMLYMCPTIRPLWYKFQKFAVKMSVHGSNRIVILHTYVSLWCHSC